MYIILLFLQGKIMETINNINIMAYNKTSFLKDFLMLIGILPMRRPEKMKQPKQQFGYQGTYLNYYSSDDYKRMEDNKKELFGLIKS
ncbi:MAG: hypothetical protein IEMM0006_1594 [bacterium]|nr:MAG: hypothetical protein IEMM0006_1594 [bacterium]